MEVSSCCSYFPPFPPFFLWFCVRRSVSLESYETKGNKGIPIAIASAAAAAVRCWVALALLGSLDAVFAGGNDS